MTQTTLPLKFTLNGEPVAVEAQTHLTLLEVLQERFGIAGARESCGQGLCGTCTVIVNGQAVTGCLYPAAFADGADVRTIEDAPAGGGLDPVQQAFIACGAFQCGFCTPGFVLMSRQLLDEIPDPTDEQIRHYLAGNLCRCAAYPEILAAVKLAARRRREGAGA